MKGKRVHLPGWLLLSVLMSAGSYAPASPKVTAQFYGTVEGNLVELYTLTNRQGAEAVVTNYGGILVALKMPDSQGHLDDIVLGFNKLSDYLKDHPYFGGTIGRYGNRIAHGRFVLNGKEVQLAVNNGPNALHGGLRGFNKVVWDSQGLMSPEGPAVELTYLSKDGEEGYPGTLKVTVQYTLSDDNALKINYQATTDKETVLNLTHHSYFNLSGEGSGDVLDHSVTIHAGRFTPVDKDLIPTGELRPVKGTPFDFNESHKVGERIAMDDPQLGFAGGYDHNFVLDGPLGPTLLRSAATVIDPRSGRMMEVLTTEPGLQFYTGNFLDGKLKGKGGRAYRHRYGLVMEAQHFPDSPNHPQFPSVTLKPGETYRQTTLYRFFYAKTR